MIAYKLLSDRNGLNQFYSKYPCDITGKYVSAISSRIQTRHSDVRAAAQPISTKQHTHRGIFSKSY